MAGDWIKVEHVTPDKPEVVKMAALLGIDQDAVVGKLIRLWVWADQQSRDGHALSVTETFLDRLVFHPGFAAAMMEAEWLADLNGLSIPNFDRHNGKSAKSRALSNRRKSESRKCHAESGTETGTREEKRREENIKGAPTSPQKTNEPMSPPDTPRAPKRKHRPAHLQECLAMAARIGMGAAEARAWYADMEAAEWRDREGMLFGSWVRVMTCKRDLLADKRMRFGRDKTATPGGTRHEIEKARKELEAL